MGRLPRPRAQPIQPLRALASLGTKVGDRGST